MGQAPKRQSENAAVADAPVEDTARAELQYVQTNVTAVELLGQVVWLMSQSPAHRHFFLADLDWLVTPPMRLQQLRLYRREGTPVGLVSWARVTEAVEQRLISGARRLAPDEWNQGDRLWLIDIVAPMGGNAAMIADLQKSFPGEPIKSLRPKADGTGFEAIVVGEP